MGQKRKRVVQEALVAAPVPKKQQRALGKISKKAASPPPLDTSPFLESPNRTELNRELQLYNLVSSEDSAERLNGANAIISALLGGEGVAETTLQRHLERKLFRGLASGRKGARIGYSIVLAEILAQLLSPDGLSTTKYISLTFEKLLEFLVEKTKPNGDLSGQEEKDHFLGLLFGLQSFVRAKILFGKDMRWKIVLEKVFELAKKKPWMREECGWVVVEALAQMSQAQAKSTLKDLNESGLGLSPEGVGIWLTARNRFPDMKFPSKPWGQSGNPLEHLKSLGKALKESALTEDTKSKTPQANQTGNWNPQLHFVWNLVLAQYAAGVKNKTHGIKSDFENFWKVAVDENLFSATASRERKFWGFLLFQKVLSDPASYEKFLPSIFSQNLMRSLINHIQEKDRFLNRAADKSLKVLITTVEGNPNLLTTILPRLLGGYGTYNFDKVTKTKTIERLLSTVNDDNAQSVIKVLIEPTLLISDTFPDMPKEAETRRQMLGDYVLTIIRRTNITDEATNPSWLKEKALPTLGKFAYSNNSKCQPSLSEKTRTVFRDRLMSAFSHLLSDLEGFSYPCNLLQSISPDAVQMDAEITETVLGALSTMEKILKKVKKVNLEGKPPLQALALLYSLVVFQLFNGEPEAVSILDELKLCYDKLIRGKSTEDSNADASEVLVELLLSFISKPSALLRKVTQHVFGAFMADITAGGLTLMTDVLESSESLRGQQELFDQEPEDGDLMGSDESGDELDSDVEVVDMNGEEGHLNGHLQEDDESKDEESKDDESEEDEESEEIKQLESALALALGTRPLTLNEEEQESNSDADMTDSEMLALDNKLVEIFSQRKKIPNKKQEQKDAKETMINFKSRVLDLLDIYVKKQAGSPLAFGLVLPLLQLMRTTKTKTLTEKAHNILLSFARAFRKEKVEDVEVNITEQIKLLKKIHEEAAQDPTHIFAKAASTASLLVTSSIYRADRGALKKVAGVYRDSQIRWVEGGTRFQASFFVEWVNWCQSHAKENSTDTGV